MISFPYCKINLGLCVLSKRNDGYHEIETCFYPVPRTDILEVIPANAFTFTQSGPLVDGGIENNLCVKAFRLIQKEFGIGEVQIHLHKTLPMGAGLGGGSSDAAFTMRLLNNIFQLNIPVPRLKALAAQLGSDCAFFVDDAPMIGTGRGEILTTASVDLKGKYLVLVKPDVHVSTVEAYSGIQAKRPAHSIQETLRLPITNWKNKLVNDFEPTIFKKHPLIQQVKEKLYSLGALYASMSGSGACVYGIFEKAADLKRDFPAMDYWSGELK
ncbi:MAG TPA: 4-(cytidine 5'-diphospho)-2-C-methyl-D-erythritol kinase [Cyclobacteriaceae bacterium]|jgi:4-diphosphocytidyl-2-C-methyl-D-erythritol kinase|nr:4-(cytidine 5'-diphospho)-2-C-methyl-D-erythritol kinase [Cyclobacteriaceae bacterium]